MPCSLTLVSLLGYVILIAASVLQLSSSANDCSFVRSYQNEECVYNIHLTQHNDKCDGPVRDGRHLRIFHSQDTAQNDYAEKLDSIEKSFSFLKDEHEKRLKDLESTVRDLLRDDFSIVRSAVELPTGGSELAQPLDNAMLTQLHEELGKLRLAVRQKTEQLLDTQLKVNETANMFEKSQLDLFAMNQELLTAENRVAVLERERAILKNQLKDRSYRMDVSSEQLSTCELKFKEQQDQLLKLIRSENTLTEELMTCELTLNKTTEELLTLEARHKQLKSRHNRVTEVLSIREKELIDCYAAKTMTFCGFEDPNLCGFTQTNDTSDFFDWEWIEGTTPSRHTGPSADHTCGYQTGHFMYIEASAKGRGKNAIIYSPLYRSLTEQCLQFYYHMYGKHIGTLNVYARVMQQLSPSTLPPFPINCIGPPNVYVKARGGTELASVWRAWGNQGDIWSVARLSIPRELARAGYQIAFEGITENGYLGDMAIDDVSVRDGECEISEGIQPVLVQLNTTGLLAEGKKFARNVKRMRLSKIPAKISQENQQSLLNTLSAH